MNPWLRRLSYFTGLTLVLGYTYIFLRGPQGLPHLMEKRQQIRALEENNEELSRQNALKRERAQRLRTNTGEVELEIRTRLKKQKEGETSYIVPSEQ